MNLIDVLSTICVFLCIRRLCSVLREAAELLGILNVPIYVRYSTIGVGEWRKFHSRAVLNLDNGFLWIKHRVERYFGQSLNRTKDTGSIAGKRGSTCWIIHLDESTAYQSDGKSRPPRLQPKGDLKDLRDHSRCHRYHILLQERSRDFASSKRLAVSALYQDREMRMLSTTDGRTDGRTVRVHVVISSVESLRARIGQCPRNQRYCGVCGTALHEMLPLCYRSWRINTEHLLARVDEVFLRTSTVRLTSCATKVLCGAINHCGEDRYIGYSLVVPQKPYYDSIQN